MFIIFGGGFRYGDELRSSSRRNRKAREVECKEQKDLQKVTFKIASLFTTTGTVKSIDKVELSKKELTEWIGNYRLNNNTYITITLINDSLYGYNSNKKNIIHKK